jgi:hypothetical protein
MKFGREIYGHISKSWKLVKGCWMVSCWTRTFYGTSKYGYEWWSTPDPKVSQILRQHEGPDGHQARLGDGNLPGKSMILYIYLVVSCLDSLEIKNRFLSYWSVHLEWMDFRNTSRTGSFSSRRHVLRIAWLAFMTLMAMGAWNPRAQQKPYLQMAMWVRQCHVYHDWDDWEWYTYRSYKNT